MHKLFFFCFTAFALVAGFSSCKSSKKNTNTPPQIRLDNSTSIIYIPHHSQEYSYVSSLKIDTFKNYTLSYVGMGQNPEIKTITGQYTVLLDSSFELRKGIILKKQKDNYFLKISTQDTLSDFLFGEYSVENLLSHFQDETDALMALAGYSFIFRSNENNMTFVASEYGKIFELGSEPPREFDLMYKTSRFGEGFYFIESFDDKLKISISVIAESKNYYLSTIDTENERINGKVTLLMPQIWLNGNWELVEIEGKNIRNYNFPNSKPVINLSGNGQRLIGTNGCNQIFGSLNYVGNTFKWMGNLGSTKMYCENTDDNLFTEKLNSSNNFITDGDNLEMYENEKLLLRFRKKEGTLEK